jgi:FtsP/CotA-like multicopper oxidase with cupredoxin domain
MNLWEKRLKVPDGKKAAYKLLENARYFKLTTQPIKQDILSEITIDGLGYNGITPGPLIILKQGEVVLIEVENRMDEPTALHVHGLSKPNSQDGMPAIEPTPKIKPGESFTYKFVAWQSGTFFYHSSDPRQESHGLIGAFVVLPNEVYQVPNYDYVLFVQQWEIEQPELGVVKPGVYKPKNFNRNPNFFTINGKAFPETTPLETRFGELVRMRFINNSNQSHTMHIHGHDFRVVGEDGFLRKGKMMDTINVASGKRFDIELLANNPGVWPVNGTKPFHKTNNGVSPGGMLTRLKYLS